MNEQLPATRQQPNTADLDDLVPRPMLYPGENSIVYQGLHDALLADLAPGTPYERLLAESLITLEWEIIRYREMRDTLVSARVLALTIGAFATGEIKAVNRPDAQAKDLASALYDGHSEGHTNAVATLVGLKIKPAEIVAEAYSQVAPNVEMHQKLVADGETRRRRLREDYGRLRAARARPVEEAEIVE